MARGLWYTIIKTVDSALVSLLDTTCWKIHGQIIEVIREWSLLILGTGAKVI